MRYFHELPVGEEFQWRERRWVKSRRHHARPVAEPEAELTNVPSHEWVETILPDPPAESTAVVKTAKNRRRTITTLPPGWKPEQSSQGATESEGRDADTKE